MNAQDAVSAPRIHHQWYPDKLYMEPGFSPDTIKELERRGHTLREGRGSQGVAQVIVHDVKGDVLEGGTDRRASDGAAIGVIGQSGQKQTTAVR